MATEREVLKEFLVALGFQVDQSAARKFVGYLEGLSKTAAKTGATVLGVAVAAEAMVQRVASGMEKLYYSSQRTGASAKNIQALQFGFKQIGLTADDASQSLDAMSKALRINPGMAAVFKHFGVDSGQDRVKVMLDMVKAISEKYPDFVGVKWANMMGMSEDTYLRVKDNLAELTKAYQKSLDLQKLTGVNADKVAEQYKNYMNAIGEVWEKTKLLSLELSTKLLPHFHEFLGVVNEVMSDLIKFGSIDVNYDDMNSDLKTVLDTLLKIGKAVSDVATSDTAKGLFWFIKNEAVDALRVLGGLAESVSLMKEGKWAEAGKKFTSTIAASLAREMGSGTSPEEDAVNALYGGAGRTSGGKIRGLPGGAPPVLAGAPRGTASGLFDQLEQLHGLPKGLLDSMWKQESNRGDPRFMKSSAGAEGHFGFMPGTAQQYGVKDPHDLTQAATGAAAFMADLLQKYANLDKALAAYNWGPGNVDRKGLGAAPSETRAYIPSVKGRMGDGNQVTLNHDTTININGGDPQATGRAVTSAQNQVYAESARNVKGAVN